MKAVVYERYGGPDVLETKDIPEPIPGPGEVLVDVAAAGVNFRDVYERSGTYRHSPPPAIPGLDGAGVVVDTGERVAWVGMTGSYAQRIVVPKARLAPVPDELSLELAAAVILQGMSAHCFAFDSYPVQPGDWTLVHAVAGGVGLLLTQMIKGLGGHVIGTASSDSKRQCALTAGADYAIPYDGFVSRVMEITEGRGVSAVYDGVGKATFLDGFEVLAPLGSMVLFGLPSGQPDPIDIGMLSSTASNYVQRPKVDDYVRTSTLLEERSRRVFDLVLRGELDVLIGGRYSLADARQAHIDIEGRGTMGKLLIVP